MTDAADLSRNKAARRDVPRTGIRGADASRCDSLRVAAGAASGAVLASTGVAGEAQTPLFDISLAQWSLHRRHFGRQSPKLDPLDFAATARGFGIGAVEYVNQFFFDKARAPAYLSENDGIVATRKLLERVRGRLASA